MYDTIIKIFNAVLIYGLQLSFLIAAVILVVRDRNHIRDYWKSGLTLGSVIFLLLLPAMIFGLIYVRPPVQNVAADMTLIILRLIFSLSILFGFLKIGWYMLLYVIARAEWKRVDIDPPLRVRNTQDSVRQHVLAALLFGLLSGVGSYFLFMALHIREGDSIEHIRRLFPAIETASPLALLPMLLAFVMGAAILEELVFRGGVLAWMTGKNPRALRFVLSAVFTSLAWSVMHIPNTDQPPLKILQIFILGIAFAWLARRSSIHAAIAAHMGLNIATTLVPFALGV